MLNLVVGFVLGATAIMVAEALCLYYILNRVVKRSNSKSKDGEVDHHQSLTYALNKQGTVWALEPDKVPKPKLRAADGDAKTPLKDQKMKKELFDVVPVKKFAKIDNHSLILTDAHADATASKSKITINLSGATVLAVSATNLPTRKWAKRFPVKIEGGDTQLYKGSTTCYLYFETSWEKESWCKALRLASCTNKDRSNWYAKLNQEFRDYLTYLKAGYPSFMKPTSGFFCEPTDRAVRTDGSSSKVRLFLKKLTRKSSKTCLDMDDKSRSSQDGSRKTITANNHSGESTPRSQSGSQAQVSVIPDVDSDDKFSIDEGTLCWNLLISRLFFDAGRNTDMRSSIQARIQRTLSNMRTPSYIGGVTCTSLDLGILPPYIHSMRVLPTDMNEVWAMEIDIQYSGGAVLDIETRLEIREAEFEKGIVNASIDSNSVDDVTSDLLEGFEHFGKQLNLPGEKVSESEKKDEGDEKFDVMKKSNSWRSPYMSRWKLITNSIANHVSQVPISLAIKVASVRGTLRLHIKPPPSDQLWFGFTSMPEIDFDLESSVGDRKISSTHVALLLENRFKAAIRETLVLPNCENIYIPWMLAEKDDWVPKRVAPFVRINQETNEVPGCQPSEANNKGTSKQGQVDSSVESADERSVSQNGLTSSSNNYLSSDKDLKIPLLSNESTESSRLESPEIHLASRSVSSGEDGNGNGKRTGGRKARFVDLGKKMGEKLEEKRRNIEEKSRHIVEKMRGPT